MQPWRPSPCSLCLPTSNTWLASSDTDAQTKCPLPETLEVFSHWRSLSPNYVLWTWCFLSSQPRSGETTFGQHGAMLFNSLYWSIWGFLPLFLKYLICHWNMRENMMVRCNKWATAKDHLIKTAKQQNSIGQAWKTREIHRNDQVGRLHMAMKNGNIPFKWN